MKSNTKKKYDLEDRLIEFAVRIIDTAEALPKTVASKNLSGQAAKLPTSVFKIRSSVFDILNFKYRTPNSEFRSVTTARHFD